jgi:hypothetical protein
VAAVKRDPAAAASIHSSSKVPSLDIDSTEDPVATVALLALIITLVF